MPETLDLEYFSKMIMKRRHFNEICKVYPTFVNNFVTTLIMWPKKIKINLKKIKIIITVSHQFLSTTGQHHTGQGNTDW